MDKVLIRFNYSLQVRERRVKNGLILFHFVSDLWLHKIIVSIY
jgi:hypothetical protein